MPHGTRMFSLLVARPDLTSWAVLDGTAELSPVTITPGDTAGEALAELYLAMAGVDHPDWEEFATAMIHEQRRVLTITIDHTYTGGFGDP